MPDNQKEARFRAWVEEYGDAILRFCYLRLQDYHLAEDAVQNTFLKVYP